MKTQKHMTASGFRAGGGYLLTASLAALAQLAGCSDDAPTRTQVNNPDGSAGDGPTDSPTTIIDAGAGDSAAASADAAGDAAGDVGGDALVLPACASLTNPVYVMSGDTQVPILKALGKSLRQDSASPVTLVWQATGSCSIIDAVYNGTPLKQNLSYIPSDPAWDINTGTVPTCTPDAAGAPVQLGIPIVFPESCTTTVAPVTVKAYKGPIQSFVFVVPKVSTAQAISAEEAYMVFGFGAAGGVLPWNDEAFYYVRPATKGTQVSLGAIIGVPAAKWKGLPIDQSTAVASMLAASTAPQKAIGILGTEIYDSAANRAALRTLSFEGIGQTGGYFPDTSVTAFDKRNVRDGHYLGWSHVFYLTPVDSGGAPTVANAARVIDILTARPGAAAPADVDPLTLVAGKGLVPSCAMNVQRGTEGGPVSAFASDDPCGCAYEASVAGAAPASCIACSATAPCAEAGTTCHHGFCEAADGRTSLWDCTAGAPANDPVVISNFHCDNRSVADERALPQAYVDHGGTRPPLP
jgi:hypothetical protein